MFLFLFYFFMLVSFHSARVGDSRRRERVKKQEKTQRQSTNKSIRVGVNSIRPSLGWVECHFSFFLLAGVRSKRSNKVFLFVCFLCFLASRCDQVSMDNSSVFPRRDAHAARWEREEEEEEFPSLRPGRSFLMAV